MKNSIFLSFFLLLILLSESPVADWATLKIEEYQIEGVKDKLAHLVAIQYEAVHSENLHTAFQKLAKHEYSKKGIYAFKYLNGRIQDWTTNQIALPTDANQLFRLDKSILKLSDGWYIPVSKESGDTILLSLLLVQKEFPVNNTYLNHSPNQAISEQELIVSNSEKEYIKGVKNRFPFLSVFSVIIWIGWFIAFVRWFKYSKLHTLLSVFIIISVAIFRLLLLHYGLPRSVQTFSLFNPEYYAYSWWMPSLGDWLINILLFIWAGNCLMDLTERLNFEKPSIRAIIATLWFISAPVFYVWIIQNIVVHSNLQLNVANLLQTTEFSWLALSGLCLLGLFLIEGSAKMLSLSAIGKPAVLFATILGSILSYIQRDSLSALIAIWTFNIGSVFYAEFQSHKILDVLWAKIAVSGIIVSLFLSTTLYDFNSNKENREINYLAGKLSSGRDLVQEYLFRKTTQRIITDRKVKNHLAVFPATSQKLSKELSSYLSGQWDGFTTQFYLFSPSDSLVLNSDDTPKAYKAELDYLISKSEHSSSPDLWLLSSESAFRYISRIELALGRGKENKKFILYFLFTKQNNSSSLGYPDILLEKGISLRERLQAYSYSVNRDGKLIQQYENHGQNEVKDIEWKYESDDGRSEVLFARSETVWLSYLNMFTVLFSLFFILSLLELMLRGKFMLKGLFSVGLRFKIVLVTTCLLTLTLLAIGYASTRLMVQQFEHKSLDMAEEKLAGIKFKLQKTASTISESNIKDLSEAFHTDINIFNSSGLLLATSRRAVFEDGFVSEMMQNEAFQFLSTNPNRFFSQKENIGKLRFLSVYAPINILGCEYYLNVPFFARQDEIKAELSKMVSSLINIYFVLVALSVLLTLIISGYITAPIETMAEKLTEINLQNPQYISWKSNDEIGKLVHSYNLMVGELAKNSAELARSEREMAWREMAKQVAHEIKNPLTPMKLQVQHLLMRYQNKSEGWELQLEKTLPILEEQINSLADIATAFSNFAKMPQGNPKTFDLRKIIETTQHIYETSENLILEVDLPDTPLNIYADREQFTRVIHNLVKNAYQAIPAEQVGKIRISARQISNQIILTISDNGIGISEEVAAKMFSPNFTTKSSGMGLGLAIVRNIVEQWGGTISFESEVGKGTVFTIVINCE